MAALSCQELHDLLGVVSGLDGVGGSRPTGELKGQFILVHYSFKVIKPNKSAWFGRLVLGIKNLNSLLNFFKRQQKERQASS